VEAAMRCLFPGILIAFILLVPSVALGADDVLQLRTGQLAVGEITSLDAKGVTLTKDGSEAHYAWDVLTPICQYEVRSDHLEPADAKGRVELAEFCLRYGLYSRARKELDTARGLGYGDRANLDRLSAVVNEAEAEAAFSRIDQLILEEEYPTALEEIRRFLIQAPQSDQTRRARAMVPDLLRRIESQSQREEEARQEALDEAKAEEIAKRLARYLESAEAARRAATEAYAEASRYHQIGNVTRARKAYERAEQSLLSAYRDLRKVQQIAREGVAAQKAAKDKLAIRGKLTEIYLGLARLYLDDRNYKKGVPYVHRVLYLDPVNKAALDMRREVDERRIRRRLSGMTNAYPR
jgi:tetratricopeptide (TPR) repeat protein